MTKYLNEKKLTNVLGAIKKVVLGSYSLKSLENIDFEIIRTLRKIVPFDSASLFRINTKKNKLEKVAVLGDGVEIINFLGLDKGDGLSGWTAQSKKPLLLSDRSQNQDFDPDNDCASFMSIPICVNDNIVGVINLGSKKPEAFKKDDVDLIVLALKPIALSMEKFHYQKKCETLSDNLKKIEEQYNNLGKKIINTANVDFINEQTASINHEINNSLSIIIGNVQCLLVQETNINQKSMSRLKRIESAALKIKLINEKITEINRLVNNANLKAEHFETVTK